MEACVNNIQFVIQNYKALAHAKLGERFFYLLQLRYSNLRLQKKTPVNMDIHVLLTVCNAHAQLPMTCNL